MLTLPASSRACSTSERWQRRQQHKKSKGKGKGGSSSSTPRTTKDFAYLMDLPVNFPSNFHERFHDREICYPFPKGTCKNGSSCKFAHICVGSGAPNLMMSASALPTRPPEPLRYKLLRRVRKSPRCPLSLLLSLQ